jgi:GT2 family glycosyltransferase
MTVLGSRMFPLRFDYRDCTASTDIEWPNGDGATSNLMKTLNQIVSDHQGKVTDKWTLYIHEYEHLFARFRDKPVVVLEIGVQNGGSLELWNAYFPAAKAIIGCDINPACENLQFNADRIHVVIGDANTDQFARQIATISPSVDIIIDDGSHTSKDIIGLFSRYFPLLEDDGLYVIEDLHCSYWKSYEGGLSYPYSSVSFLKGLTDILHHEHWGISKQRRELLIKYSRHYGVEFDEDVLASIDSVTFVNSICAIKKNTKRNRGLGCRCVIGSEAHVCEQILPLRGVISVPPDQGMEPWTRYAFSLEEDLIDKIEDLDRSKRGLETRIEELGQSLLGCTGQLNALRTTLAGMQEARTALEQEFASSQRLVEVLRQQLVSQRESHANGLMELQAILNSTSWKVTYPARRFLERHAMTRRWLRRSLTFAWWTLTGQLGRRMQERRRQIRPLGSPLTDKQDPCDQSRSMTLSYEHWIARFDQLREADKMTIKRHMSTEALPAMLVVACFDTFSQNLIDAWLDRLKRQLLDRWQAVLVFGRDCAPHAVESLKAKTESDGRFTVVQAPLDDADRQVVACLENATLVLVASSDVVFREHTLYAFATAVTNQPEARLVYSDEDYITADGTRSAPWFKPDFSPELLRSVPYLGVCALLNRPDLDLRTMVDRVLAEGGLASFLTQYARTLSEQTVIHLPFILYHHSGKVKRANDPAQPVELEEEELPKVSIIIPTKDRLDLLAPCLASIENTSYPFDKLEIIVIDNGTSDPDTLCFLSTAESEGRIRLIRDSAPFNYSRLNNRATTLATGDILVFLNNDTEVNRNYWLRRLVSYAIQPKIGVVGAKLLYPDRTVQHGGVVVGIQGVAAHAHVGIAEEDGGYQNLANVTHEVSAVTGACIAVRRSVFQELGGFDQALAVAFNDVLLCLTAMTRGYRNIFIAEPLVIHHESKTRGFDDTPAKRARFHRETIYVRSIYRALFKNDPHYNPNLSLERVHDLAWPPRVRRPWSGLASRNGPLRLLMLSVSHEVGYGVAVVLRQQSVDLARRGFEVFIGGPCGRNEFIYEGCHRVYLDDPREAACFAFENDVDCIMAHTPPFFSIVRWLGSWPRSIIYDYGEPTPELFPDAAARRDVNAEKRFCYGLADRTFAISRSVQAESGYPGMGVIRLGNSHLAAWNRDIELRRKLVRRTFDVDDKLLVLNVCRFHRAERQYKGIDVYANVLWELGLTRPDLRERTVFALCGKAGKEDVREMEELGLQVFPNLSDSELIDLYAAADVYMNFSRWEGYNLGIGQALALGLPVIASDIPAHREFPISTSNDMTVILRKLCTLADEWSVKARLPRKPIIYSWEEPLTELASTISYLCRDQHKPSYSDCVPRKEVAQLLTLAAS